MTRRLICIVVLCLLAASAAAAASTVKPRSIWRPRAFETRLKGLVSVTPGQTLQSSNGGWTNNPTGYTYQWEDCNTSGAACSNIPGATGGSYVVRVADIGSSLRVVVTATNAGGSASQSSAATPVVTAAIIAPANTTLPAVTGAAQQGQTLTTTTGTWSGTAPITYTYQWQRDRATSIAGATSATYTAVAGDVGHTLDAVLTAHNAAGNVSATSASTALVAVSGGGGLPAGVTLTPIDGGADYYCSHGFTNACSGGWDSPSFYPIGPWYGSVSTQSDVTLWSTLGLNTAFRTTGNTSLPLMRTNGLFAIVDDEGAPETPGMAAETVGLLAADEPPDLATFTHSLASTPNAQQDGRFWYVNNTWNFINYGGLTPDSSSADVLAKPVATPGGATRHDDTQSVDQYWFAGSKGGSAINYQGGLLYNLGHDMTGAQAQCGCRYGDMVDSLRGFQAAFPAPIGQLVENGGPMTEDTLASSYITPPEMNWSAWSSIIHGARQLIYFNNSFAGPGINGNNIAGAYYQTPQGGQAVSIDAQTAATDGLVKQLAPDINAPVANGYLTVQGTAGTANGPYGTFSGIETRATYNQAAGRFTIFADTRDVEASTPGSVTFHAAGGYTGPVTVVCDSRTGGDGLLNPGSCVNRTVTAANGTFSDTFATGSTVHVYQIPLVAAVVAPANTTLPLVTGTTTQGQALTASTGTWTGSPTYAYQWERCNASGAACVNIASSTAGSYTLAAGDVGSTLRVAVAATNAGGTVTATSNATAVVASNSTPPVNTTLPAVTGLAQQAQTLTATAGTWTGTAPIAYAYQWKRAGVAIGGATTNNYTLVSADVGATLTIVVTATNTAGSAAATSSSTAIVTSNTTKLRVSVMNTSGWNVDSMFTSIGVTWERLDVGDGSNITLVNAGLSHGMKALVLYSGNNGTLNGESPSTAASQVVTLANKLKPLGLTEIEFGNEVYAYENVATYAAQYDAAHRALVGMGVKLLAVGTALNAYNSTATWIPTFISDMSGGAGEVDGWTIHPYGPMVGGTVNGFDWQTVGFWHTIAVNAGSTAPWYITEVGQCLPPPTSGGCNNTVPAGTATDPPGTGTSPFFTQAADMTQYLNDTLTLYPWVVYFDWYTSCDDSSGAWGLITKDGNGNCFGTPRPAYYALANWMASHASVTAGVHRRGEGFRLPSGPGAPSRTSTAGVIIGLALAGIGGITLVAHHRHR